jgi:hypothetical protein
MIDNSLGPRRRAGSSVHLRRRRWCWVWCWLRLGQAARDDVVQIITNQPKRSPFIVLKPPIRTCKSTTPHHEQVSLGIRLQFNQLEAKVMAGLRVAICVSFRQNNPNTLLYQHSCTARINTLHEYTQQNGSAPTRCSPYPMHHVHCGCRYFLGV